GAHSRAPRRRPAVAGQSAVRRAGPERAHRAAPPLRSGEPGRGHRARRRPGALVRARRAIASDRVMDVTSGPRHRRLSAPVSKERTMNTVTTNKTVTARAQIEREFTVEGVEHIHGVTYDGERVWFADGTRGGLTAVDPETGKEVKRFADIP